MFSSMLRQLAAKRHFGNILATYFVDSWQARYSPQKAATHSKRYPRACGDFLVRVVAREGCSRIGAKVCFFAPKQSGTLLALSPLARKAAAIAAARTLLRVLRLDAAPPASMLHQLTVRLWVLHRRRGIVAWRCAVARECKLATRLVACGCEGSVAYPRRCLHGAR